MSSEDSSTKPGYEGTVHQAAATADDPGLLNSPLSSQGAIVLSSSQSRSSQGLSSQALAIPGGTISIPSSQGSPQGSTTTLSSSDPPPANVWLENLMGIIFKSSVEAMRECLVNIKDCLSSHDTTEEFYGKLQSYLDCLMEYTEVMDNAIDFYKIGGFEILKPLLEIPNNGVKAKTLELIGDLTQNNSYCQEKAKEYGLFKELFSILDADEDESVCLKALYGISCLCRANPEAISSIVELDGFNILIRALEKQSERITTKAAFLLTHLSLQMPECRDVLQKMGIIELLLCLLLGDYSSSTEHLLRCLCSFVFNHEPSRVECLSDQLRLSQTVAHLMKIVEDHPESLEIQDCLNNLRQCFGENEKDSDDERKILEETER